MMETPGTAPNGSAGSRGKPARVLVVDDDASMRSLCSLFLKLEGFDVFEAADGHGALALARSERPDLVLTDVTMPRVDGFELAEALRGDEQTREIPLIFLTGEAEEAHRERAHALGAHGYLTKPFDPQLLVSLVLDAVTHVGPRPLVAAQSAA